MKIRERLIATLFLILILMSESVFANATTTLEKICSGFVYNYIISYLYTDNDVRAFYNLYDNNGYGDVYLAGSWTGDTNQSVNFFCPSTLRTGGFGLSYRYLGSDQSNGIGNQKWAVKVVAPVTFCDETY